MSPQRRDRAAERPVDAPDRARWARASARRGALLERRDPRDDAFAQLRACRDLDEVLALDTPARLVARLFGANASKTLIAPLGDALLRGFARGSRTHSQIAVAAAASDLLDAKRLERILSLDDHGHDLAPSNSPTDLAADLVLVLGHYRDRDRRMRLLSTLWHETLHRCDRAARGEADLEVVRARAKSAIAGAHRYVVTTASNAASTMVKTAAAAMVFEWQVQGFLVAENAMVLHAAAGREVDLTTLPWGDSHVPKKADVALRRDAAFNLLVATARVRAAHEHLTALLPKDPLRLGEATRRAPALRRHTFVQEILPARVEALIRFAASDRYGDAETVSAQDNGFIYSGALCSLSLRMPPEHVPSAPPRRMTVNESAAQVAQLVRLGAALPEKPTGWDALLRRVCEPYYVGAALTIDAPEWVHELHGATVPGTSLQVRIPRDMTELSLWADCMGNCIRSVFGDDVHEGRRVILALVDGEELRFNVGVDATSRRVWEINSRFNTGDVSSEVSAGVESLLARVRNHDVSPSTRQPRVPAAPGRKRERSFTRAQRAEIDAVVAELNDQRADDQRADHWSGGADLTRLAIATGAPARPDRWTSALTAVRRGDEAEVIGAFLRELEAGTFEDPWSLVMHHPLDAFDDQRRFDPRVLTSLRYLRDGDDRAQLAQTAPLLDAPVLDAAWQLGRLQVALRRAVLTLALDRPLAVRPLLRNDRAGAARWALGLVFVVAADDDPTLLTRSGPLAWFDLADANVATSAAADAARLDPTRRDAVLAAVDPTAGGTLATRRAELGLAPARCPRAWFARSARPVSV